MILHFPTQHAVVNKTQGVELMKSQFDLGEYLCMYKLNNRTQNQTINIVIKHHIGKSIYYLLFIVCAKSIHQDYFST